MTTQPTRWPVGADGKLADRVALAPPDDSDGSVVGGAFPVVYEAAGEPVVVQVTEPGLAMVEDLRRFLAD